MAAQKRSQSNSNPPSSSSSDSSTDSAQIYPFEKRLSKKAKARKTARQRCIETCQETYLLLAQTATELAGRKNRPLSSELTLLWDGAQAAHVATEYLIRQSPSALLIASTCAEICDDIADELESKYEEEDSPEAPRLLDCAEQARLLADACDGLADAEAFESPAFIGESSEAEETLNEHPGSKAFRDDEPQSS